MKNIYLFVGVITAGFMGGLCAQLYLSPMIAAAQSFSDIQGKNLYLYTAEGENRLQLATYDRGGEKGQPLIGLYDNGNKLRLLLRLAGTNESPVLIFKDNDGRDRVVLGLSLDDPNEDPFLAYFDKDGSKHLAFGSY